MSDRYEEYEERVRQRAYAIWQREGEPHGCADAHWALAREEVSTAENIETTLKDPNEEPIAEPLFVVEGQADIPGRLSDQGERQDYPSEPASTAKKPRAKRA